MIARLTDRSQYSMSGGSEVASAFLSGISIQNLQRGAVRSSQNGAEQTHMTKRRSAGLD
jgi:hypothetical protein